MTYGSTSYNCPLSYGDERQVQVHGIPGVHHLPCTPAFGCTNPVSRIQNGTFVRFDSWKQLGGDEDSIVWVFTLSEDSSVQVWISPEALVNNWLWKVKRQGNGRRSHGWGRR